MRNAIFTNKKKHKTSKFRIFEIEANKFRITNSKEFTIPHGLNESRRVMVSEFHAMGCIKYDIARYLVEKSSHVG